jgi:hypothetical protein
MIIVLTISGPLSWKNKCQHDLLRDHDLSGVNMTPMISHNKMPIQGFQFKAFGGLTTLS